jgi:hypothetical protein
MAKRKAGGTAATLANVGAGHADSRELNAQWEAFLEEQLALRRSKLAARAPGAVERGGDADATARDADADALAPEAPPVGAGPADLWAAWGGAPGEDGGA